ncbi:MAG: Pyridoxine 5'-phosphate synthase [Alphaproteobacteria bacterium MarineAlpha5_Bin5]|nr:MAG: Pyridoxine 5'-phosphate synthase [Alphaproteobacteria bacterium MarineAlpha5_Bin5]PPR50669.1 MAG: Pyridoxine 5'-phosphate synthase [Alphaproteobacteria bacterium MarineAlpha5_Bin4]|tara:strand:+ start:818 stop:1552 length:735 start_codon:yes stop_codon:yes gene_type:complete
MTALSVNVNKFALIRNARDADHPNLLEISKKCINFGANGITIHPRPDERHAKFSDLMPLKQLVSTFDNVEFNVEGYPSESFIEKVIEVYPDQVTLVPDPPDALTSSFGWDCEINKEFLNNVVKTFQNKNIRVSIFINPSTNTLNNLNYIMPNRVELYTYDYAKNYSQNKEVAIGPYIEVVNYLNKNFPFIDFNAGHDLNLQNLDYLLNKINNIKEVSIGHALVCDTLEYGLETTVKKYLEIINK